MESIITVDCGSLRFPVLTSFPRRNGCGTARGIQSENLSLFRKGVFAVSASVGVFAVRDFEEEFFKRFVESAGFEFRQRAVGDEFPVVDYAHSVADFLHHVEDVRAENTQFPLSACSLISFLRLYDDFGSSPVMGSSSIHTLGS